MTEWQEKIDFIITDVGGVLIKTDEAIFECIERVAKEKNIYGGSLERIKDVLGTSIEDYIQAYLPEGYKEQTDECHKAFKKIYPFEVPHLLKPFKGVDETLEYLQGQGICLAVLSCKRRKAVKANLSLLRFQGFAKVFSIEDYDEDHKRPDPRGLKMLMKALGEEPERTVYVGDTASDIQMATRAKVISVAVGTGAQENTYLEKECPDFLVDSFRDIPTKVLHASARHEKKE